MKPGTRKARSSDKGGRRLLAATRAAQEQQQQQQTRCIERRRDKAALEWIAFRMGLPVDKLKRMLNRWHKQRPAPRYRAGPKPSVTAAVTRADLQMMSAQLFFRDAAGLTKPGTMADVINPVADRLAGKTGSTDKRRRRAAVRARLLDFIGGTLKKNERDRKRREATAARRVEG